jgi:glucose 1-dehydrogenase
MITRRYAASKGGVALLMESLAQEVASRRIRVNTIRSPINRAASETPEALIRFIPDGPIGATQDIAKAAVWLASDERDDGTGATSAA